MPTDAVIDEHVETVQIPASLTTIVQFAPMQPGRSYVVWAIGSVMLSNAKVIFELEAFEARHAVELIYSERLVQQTSFSLAVGVTIPPEDELFTAAKLSASRQPFSGAMHESGATLLTAKLVLLAVDSLAVHSV